MLDVKLVLAENDKYSVDGRTGERRDFAKEAAAEVAASRKAAAADRVRAEQETQKAAAARAALRARCAAIYSATIQKRVVDLTVQESKQIQASERLNMYPPK